MQMTIEWSWFSFLIGVAATVTASFWLLLGVAFSQWKKQRKAAAASVDAFDTMMKDWNSKK
jgi:hypothetical protein